MKKSKVMFVLFTIMLVIALTVVPTFAAATTKLLSTTFAVQNLSTTATATVHVDYRKASNDGGGAWTASAANTDFTLAPGAAANIAQYLDATLPTGRGSATVSSDQPIAAIVNQLARNQVDTSGSYTGFDSGAASVFAPLVFKGLSTSAGTINSTLTIMNTGSAATDSNCVHQRCDIRAGLYCDRDALAAGESYYADQSDETNLAAGFFGSAVVNATTAGGTVAVVGNQFTGVNALLTYNGFKSTEGYTSWAVPFYACRLANGFSAPITVKNVGASIPVGGIQIAFKPDPSLTGALATPFTLTNASAVPANASFIENLRIDTNCPTTSFGSAIVTAPSNVVVVVNQLQAGFDQALSYNGIATNNTNKTALSPVVFSRLANGYSTAITVQNLNLSASGTVTFTYIPNTACTGCAQFTKVLSVAAGGSVIQNHRLAPGTATHPLPDLWFGAARVESDQPIAGVVNQLNTTGTGDKSLSFNTISQP
jgi:hypothetical protein